MSDKDRQKEINMFAAMALGETADDSFTPAPQAPAASNDFDFAAAIRAESPILHRPASTDFDFAAAVRGEQGSGGGGNDFDFAAAVRGESGFGGDVGGGNNDGGGSFTYSKKPVPTTAAASTQAESSSVIKTRNSDASRDAFTEALHATDNDTTSGTFNFQTKTASAHSSNLAAAAAAFEADEENGSAQNSVPHNLPQPTRGNMPQKPEPIDPTKGPMFSQKVSMSRPLFFGAQLPPRVVEQARAMVLEAYAELKYKPGSSPPAERPPLHKLPPPVRNVVAVVRTYGYGIDVLGDEDPMTKYPDSYWKGPNSRVTTYQPVWGESERAKRIAKASKLRRPSAISHRSVTAPPKMGVAAAAAAATALALKTEAGQPTAEENGMVASAGPLTRQGQNEQFSQWLRGDDDSVASSMAGVGDSTGSFAFESLKDSFRDSSFSGRDSFALPLESGTNNDSKLTEMSERDLFSQWAQGGDSSAGATSVTSTVTTPNNNKAFDSSTFQLRPPPVLVESDDDSIDYDEEKKQVGLNDHLSKALASLADQSAPDEPELETHVLFSQVPTDASERPLTNYEVTGGCVPLFGVDDPPLPVESDLGIYETKEEQQRYLETKRSQEIVEKFVAPNVFGSVACPNPALNPDDFHSWNSRATGNQRLPQAGTVESLSLPSFAQGSRPRSEGGDRGSKKDGKRYRSRTRYGWWNAGNEEDWPASVSKAKETTEKPDEKSMSTDGITPVVGAKPKKETENPLSIRQLLPVHHSATALQVVTALEPTPGQLQRENLPLSRMDAATTAAQTLPYLSDRPPSYRYLQIDTQAVAFPPSGGEIEPFFCTLAIYNVETVSSSNVITTQGESSIAPVPDLQRCGRVTETLNFDIVRDTKIAERCRAALWPGRPDGPFAKLISGGAESDNEELVGTRCGVFPLPSNLSFSNLYAVLIVHKVLSEETLDAYLKPGSVAGDLEKLRGSAERASQRHAPFLFPFAFGVAPLMQVFAGSETPVITSSRAVQIPLFRFSPGHGERQVIDHIMVMLNPRADRRTAGTGGPAAPTNGGTAMLVMRSFGFLGLHQVVDSASSLARDKLVDFTGELQLLREENTEKGTGKATHNAFMCELPRWCPAYKAEPTIGGGRANMSTDLSNQSESPRYAQELAPRSLQASKLARISTPVQPGAHRGRLHGGNDIEPFFYTSFCNEMLLHPRLLHNCPKGNVVVKAELREIEWNDSHAGYFAHLPRSGPAMHNNRRGPFLVQSLFTSCSPRGSNKHFMDEFKMKLPLDLRPGNENGSGRRVLSLFFTVYNIKMHSKSKWKKLFSSTSSETKEGETETGPFRIEQVACGFLPISSDTCLIDDGLHDVRIIYTSQPAPAEYVQKGKVRASTLVLREKVDNLETASVANKEHSLAEDTLSIDENNSNAGDGLQSVASASDLTSMADESMSRSDKQKASEPISLSVRITCHSSVHAQNDTLAKILELDQEFPLYGKRMDAVFLSKLRMGRDFLTSNIESVGSRRPSTLEVKLFESVINIVKSQVCPITHSYGHVYRIFPILWRTLLCGTGEPDLTWANPASPVPLRLHTFATILQLLGGVSLYLQKNGVTNVDGMTKWNIVTLGRFVALLFDEGSLFGDQAAEAFDREKWTREFDDSEETNKFLAIPKKTSPSSRRKRHVRQNLEILDIFHQSESHDDGMDFTVPPPPATRPSVDDSMVQLASSSMPRDASTSEEKEFKVDTKMDFQSALRAAAREPDNEVESDGAKRAKDMINAFGSGTGSRRWMTAPVRALSTIRETEDIDDPDTVVEERPDLEALAPLATIAETFSKDQLDSEIHVGTSKKPKQMRIPKRKNQEQQDEEQEVVITKPSAIASNTRQKSIPQTDQEIAEAGTAFLDVIGKSLGMSASERQRATEEERVGSSHHRKTRSNSSIDWTLLGDGLISNFESRAELPKGESEESNDDDDTSDALSTLQREESNSIRLPDYVERLMVAGKSSTKDARWFPFAYEVVISQWAAILIAQRATGEKNRSNESQQSKTGQTSQAEASANQSVSQAAARSIGVAVAGAPLLFEIIKHSLGFRIHSLYEKVLRENPAVDSPPLVSLDAPLQVALEQVVSMVADACIDSRNFDSLDLRQMSINVNDSIVRFLRSMFSFLSPSTNHRLVLAYLSRFVTREGKHWQDRDSSIGLRCSWEITKLRLNAVTGLIRFPDFVRINSPQMLNLSKWWIPSSTRSDSFFTGVLERFRKYRLSRFVGGDIHASEDISIPQLHPHWLAEVVIDICLLGTEHVEPQICQRSAALLHEMFWSSSQDGILTGRTGAIASMYLTFLEKMLVQVNFLSNFAPKSQLRKDLLPCVVFVLQSTPTALLRSLWRYLCEDLPGKSQLQQYGGSRPTGGEDKETDNGGRRKSDTRSDVLDMFKLLNLALKTMEYEGSDENLEGENGTNSDSIEEWRREFLLSTEIPSSKNARNRRRLESNGDTGLPREEYTSTISRRWHSHDGSLVIMNAGHQLVFEFYALLHVIPNGQFFLNPAVRNNSTQSKIDDAISLNMSQLTKEDVVLFVRAATSLYLHALALRESDIATIRAFKVTAEIIKIFGIKTFLEAVGETLQHWMRVISLHCGARRANVRIEATDLLELMLRSTWECYGSFFRIRVPLLAVQTEVMERIVATAATRYYRDQRRLAKSQEAFTNVSAEASLVPLWRTLDRIEKQPASQNVAFRGALVRISRKLKRLYRAYIAARVLSFIQGTRSSSEEEEQPMRDHVTEALIRANRISILRVINASEGHSKQFLGFHATTQQRSRVAHFEAVEDALIDAANVFSPTELPEHRVAWLRMLADFHASRKRFAEEATCHFQIHVTLQQAAQLHGSLWSNTPFLPWTDNMPDPVYIDGDNPTTDPDYMSEYGMEDREDQYANINSFRRIFYRVANSVALGQDDWDTSGRQALFCGISSLSEYFTVSPWLTLREMEENMVEEAEAAGDLFLSAGIIESSRFALRLATEYYSQRFNYPKLAIAYGNLSRTVVSNIPQIDASLPQEVSAILGRFYRVWFHGGAPDELNGVEFVYRAEATIRLDQFGHELREVIKSIIPDKTPIHLVLDGRSETRLEDGPQNFGFRLGSTPLEPVRIKVTPLRPLFGHSSRVRGMPEWFYRYADEAFSNLHHRRANNFGHRGARNGHDTARGSYIADPHHQREHMRSFSASVFSSMGSTAGGGSGRAVLGDERASRFGAVGESELSGVDKFCFVQPKDRSLGSKDWWKYTSGNFTQKSLKVTQLQVAQEFPACVARQPVVHRLVYSQSPLEAGIDAVCQWCAVLFRTAVATIGMAVLGTNSDPGIGTDAVKVVVDCIHSSQVKEIGLSLMNKYSDELDRNRESGFSLESYDILSDGEVVKLQLKLARLIVVFFELLHLLITRNRQILLDVMQERKKAEPPSVPPAISTKSQFRSKSGEVPNMYPKRTSGPRSAGSFDASGSNSLQAQHSQQGGSHGRRATNDGKSVISLPRPATGTLHDARSDDGYRRQGVSRTYSVGDEAQSVMSLNTSNPSNEKRTGSAIAVQGELQRAFINMAKALYPKVQGIMQSDTPRWFKQCAQDSYFSLGTYKQTKVPISEEIGFTPESLVPPSHSTDILGTGYDRGFESPRGSNGGSMAGGSSHSVVSKGSDRYGYGQF